MSLKDKFILVTGSSGYVASDLIPSINSEVLGIDYVLSEHTKEKIGIESNKLKSILQKISPKEIIVVNLAAARFDFGATPKDYLRLNYECHKKFLHSLDGGKIKRFIHVSSVAALDGINITYSDELNCDDAYRSTKYLQEKLINDWCHEHNIDLTILYPSAIFSNNSRSDTNIGKLQKISQFIPFVPKIDAIKSLTYLPNFSKFIIDSITGEIPSGKYLTIEKPSLTVSKIIQFASGRSLRIINIPFLKAILRNLANILYVLSLCGKIDLKLTPNRVVKLFSETSYSNINRKDIDLETYRDRNHLQLTEILSNFNKNE